MVSHSCLLVELGPICNSMAALFSFRVVRTTVYLKAIMEVYGKQLHVWAQKCNIVRSAETQSCLSHSHRTTKARYLLTNANSRSKTQTKKLVCRVAFQLHMCTHITNYNNLDGLFCQHIISTDAVYYFG